MGHSHFTQMLPAPINTTCAPRVPPLPTQGTTTPLNHNPPRNTNKSENTATQSVNHPQRNTQSLHQHTNVKIATINMNRLCSSNEPTNKLAKWSRINETVRKKNIAILVVQETHLDDETLQLITQAFRKRLQIIVS